MKKYLIAIGAVVGLVVVIGGVKAAQIMTLMGMGESMVMPATAVTATEVLEQDWEQTLRSVGTLEAVQGVVVTADVPGRVTEILFEAGSEVKQGDVLIRQDTSSERAQLRAAEASAVLAKINLDRITALLKNNVSSQAEFDTADARYKEAVAHADTIRTNIDKKTVKAPFDGRLGIRLVDIGSDLATGSPIVSLQNIRPILVNFSLPQRDIPKLAAGLQVRLESDAVAGKVFDGEISVINSEVDASTRNVRVQARFDNSEGDLLPGMYANVKIILPDVESVLAVPATAISYATFGDSVFVVAEEKDEKTEAIKLVARQQFVRLGRARGDYVAIEAGVDAADTVVSTGVFKLRNGMEVEINNAAQPTFSLNPEPEES